MKSIKNLQLFNLEPIIKLNLVNLYSKNILTIGSRTAMGNTIFQLHVLQQVVEKSKDGILFISNDEPEDVLIRKFLAQVSSVPFEKIDENFEAIKEKHSSVFRDNIFFLYKPSTYERLRKKILKEIKKKKIKFLFIDKIQGLFSEKKFKNRPDELEYILRDLKKLAVKKDLIICLTSGLSRMVDFREGKRPQLSDLRNSSAIEEISDIVIFVHRPEYYGFTQDESGNSLIDIAEIIIGKNKMGKTGEYQMTFDKNIPKIQQ